jgi:hypothetical protein
LVGIFGPLRAKVKKVFLSYNKGPLAVFGNFLLPWLLLIEKKFEETLIDQKDSIPISN